MLQYTASLHTQGSWAARDAGINLKPCLQCSELDLAVLT